MSYDVIALCHGSLVLFVDHVASVESSLQECKAAASLHITLRHIENSLSLPEGQRLLHVVDFAYIVEVCKTCKHTVLISAMGTGTDSELLFAEALEKQRSLRSHALQVHVHCLNPKSITQNQLGAWVGACCRLNECLFGPGCYAL